MSFLYAEDAPDVHIRLQEHLRACADCRQRVDGWRQSMDTLDRWKLPEPRPRRVPQHLTRYAIAAGIVLGLGLALGRLTSPPATQARDAQAALRVYVDAQLKATRNELAQLLEQRQAELALALHSASTNAASTEAQQVLAQYAKLVDEQRETDRQAIVAAFRQLDERRQADYGTLREELQTVAVNADDGLTRAQEQLMELASATQPNP